MHGFAESFNLSVASALVLQRLLDACPESRGQLPADELQTLRARWYMRLARTTEQRALFAKLARGVGVEPFRDTRRPEAFREESRKYVSSATMRPGRRATAALERIARYTKAAPSSSTPFPMPSQHKVAGAVVRCGIDLSCDINAAHTARKFEAWHARGDTLSRTQ